VLQANRGVKVVKAKLKHYYTATPTQSPRFSSSVGFCQLVAQTTKFPTQNNTTHAWAKGGVAEIE